MKTPCVLVHGFAGSPASWDAVAGRLPADWQVTRPALAGHDPCAAWPEGVASFDDEVDRLAALVPDDGPSVLCGYSLGGRLALGLLCRHPARFAAALVIGAHPGLPAGSSPRDERLAVDGRWAERIERDLGAFVEAWQELPLFASQRRLPVEALARQDRVRRAHRADALARAMRVLSLGTMPDHRAGLSAVRVPVVLMAGALDEKFAALAVELGSMLPSARVEIVPDAGHNVPLEAPRAVADALCTLAREARAGEAGAPLP
jgi:2-succinyl-6-hydroxy-2,4-cyclohexadiene-1-carboxylate synthase